MKRPSYLRQIAAPAAGEGIARLAPPSLLFRPSPAAFTVIEADLQALHRASLRPSVPLTAAPAPEPFPVSPQIPAHSIRPPSSRVLRPAHRIAAAADEPVPDKHPAVADPHPPLNTPISVDTEHLGVQRVMALPRRSLRSSAPVASAPSKVPSVTAKPAPVESADRRAEVPRRETERAAGSKSTAADFLASVPELPAGLLPPIPDLRVQPTKSPRAQPTTPAVPPGSSVPAPAPPPLISSLAPPAPPPRMPMTERKSAGVRIGTLEIRVVAPATAPVPVLPLPAQPPGRYASRPTGKATDTNRLARGFSAFGLSQA
jgi:neural Wiskott-Aldrich syndrome protein